MGKPAKRVSFESTGARVLAARGLSGSIAGRHGYIGGGEGVAWG